MANDDITPRDKIWAIVLNSDDLVWTVEQLKNRTEVSEQTTRNTLNAMSRLGILKHKSNTKVWYVKPEFANQN